MNFTSIQNFYFPEPNEFPNLTHSVSFTTSNAKGMNKDLSPVPSTGLPLHCFFSLQLAYVVTVQYLMTFNFAVMFIVLILLILDYIFSRDQSNESRAFLNQPLNNYDTGMKFGLLLYIIYVLGEEVSNSGLQLMVILLFRCIRIRLVDYLCWFAS